MYDVELAVRPARAGMDVSGDGLPAARLPRTHLDALTDFIDGLCRAIDAVAGCIVLAGEKAGGTFGRAAADDEALAALDAVIAAGSMPAGRGARWVRDNGMARHRTLLVETGEGSGQLLLVFARRDLDADGMVARVLAAAPGLARAAGAMLATWLSSEASLERERMLAAVMNQSECGIMIVRSDHSMMFSNLAAQAILAERDGIELRRDQLRPTRYQDAVRFQASLDHIMALPIGADGLSRHSMMLLLERPGQARPLIAVIAPAAAESAEGAAAAIIYVMRPELSGMRGVEVICQLHGLSPVETQLVARLVAGTTLGEAAAEMRIKPDTARAYLKQVFAKTDTHRQSDLIQLMIRYQRAVRGDFLFHAA